MKCYGRCLLVHSYKYAVSVVSVSASLLTSIYSSSISSTGGRSGVRIHAESQVVNNVWVLDAFEKSTFLCEPVH